MKKILKNIIYKMKQNNLYNNHHINNFLEEDFIKQHIHQKLQI